ncbi:hypothetical protein AB1Y20_007805 [Prymnesium parvum]|uniref:Uncharacterized protein n=1 Tax=Prymnesium parvum TaxID=97485 RepID=A0AB34IRZ6_PRYPA
MALVRRGVLAGLCCSPRTFDAPCVLGLPKQGGLFSQLLYIAEQARDILVGSSSPPQSQIDATRTQILDHIDMGAGPVNASVIQDLQLYGYGGILSCKKARLVHPGEHIDCAYVQIGVSRLLATKGRVPPRLGQFFLPFHCPKHCSAMPASSAWSALPRLLAVSHLLHLLYQPRKPVAPPVVPAGARSGAYAFDLAIHVRRGDKMQEHRQWERLAFWNQSAIVMTAASQLRLAAGDEPPVRHRAPRVLLASDDNAFASRLEMELASQLGAKVTWLQAAHLKSLPESQAGAAAAHWSSDPCDERCVPPLLELVDGFSRAARLMVNTRSNVGTFLLTWWPAANRGRMPYFVDMDGSVAPGSLTPNRVWCDLPYGSRHGLCEGGAPPLSEAAAKLISVREDSEYKAMREHKCRPPGRDAKKMRWPSNMCCQPNAAVAPLAR